MVFKFQNTPKNKGSLLALSTPIFPFHESFFMMKKKPFVIFIHKSVSFKQHESGVPILKVSPGLTVTLAPITEAIRTLFLFISFEESDSPTAPPGIKTALCHQTSHHQTQSTKAFLQVDCSFEGWAQELLLLELFPNQQRDYSPFRPWWDRNDHN